MRRHLLPSLAAVALTAGLGSGCNQYEMFRLAGFAQEDFSNDAEILFVIDNSSSMVQESAALGVNFDVFINNLIDPTGEGGGQDGLPDAVDQYILGAGSPGRVIDFQIGITTTDVGTDYGRLYRFSGEPILKKGMRDVGELYRENLLCEATCFQGANGGLDSKVDVGASDWQCGDPLPGEDLFFEYMDCLCGEDIWTGNCGSGDEEGLEATFLALCRTLDPADTSQKTQLLLDECEDKTPFLRDTHGLTNEGFIRGPASTIIPVIVTDEGDGSRRLFQGEGDPAEYRNLFELFGLRTGWAVIGPNASVCNSGGATTWGIERYQSFVDDTQGLYLPIAEDAGEGCGVADFGANMEQLGELLARLADRFQLQAIPDVETIKVVVDGKVIDPSEEVQDPDSGEFVPGDGWTYLAAENAVQFHGNAVPDYGADVRIYYLPLAGMPRTLPF